MAMQTRHVSPKSSITLTSRCVDFQFDQVESVWLQSSIKTHFMHGLSLLVPISERAVIEILRKQLSGHTAPDIQGLIKDVIKQEGQHAAMHRRANAVIYQSHPELKIITAIQTGFMGFVRKLASPAFELAIPVAFEHVTAAISKEVLRHQDYWLKPSTKKNKAAVDFLLWHCLEELEHQGVCHTIFKQRYNKRYLVMISLIIFWLPITLASIFLVQFYLLIKDKTLLKPRNWPPYFGFIARCTGLFLKGAFKYRHKHDQIWNQEDRVLYEDACRAFHQRQSHH